MKRIALAVAAVLLLAGCGGDDQPQSVADAIAEASVTPAPEPLFEEPELLTGPVAEPAIYPGGVAAQVTSVEIGPAEVAYAETGELTWIRIVTRITAGEFTYEVGDWGPQGTLAWGPNLTEAILYASAANTDFAQIAAGSSVDFVSEFSVTVPEEQLEELRFTFTPSADYETPWVFTGVEDVAR